MLGIHNITAFHKSDVCFIFCLKHWDVPFCSLNIQISIWFQSSLLRWCTLKGPWLPAIFPDEVKAYYVAQLLCCLLTVCPLSWPCLCLQGGTQHPCRQHLLAWQLGYALQTQSGEPYVDFCMASWHKCTFAAGWLVVNQWLVLKQGIQSCSDFNNKLFYHKYMFCGLSKSVG